MEKPMSVTAPSDPARSLAPRALGRRRARIGLGLARVAAWALLAAAVLPVGAVRAQTPNATGRIYIPGPGESRAAQSSGMISIPGPGQTTSAASNVSNGANANGMIVIPGPGEARAATTAAATRPPVAAMRPAATEVKPVVAAMAAAPAAPASNVPAGQEDGETIRRAALAFLQQQTVGLPGKIGITVAQTFPRGLAACTTLEPFMPTGARLWGRTTVGVRCAGAKPWTLYLQAQISIEATYFLAARQIEPGSVVTAQDLLARNGDLSNLPRAVITDPSQAVGSTALSRISAGMPLRQDLLKSASAVTIGQTVRVVAQGQGFAISSEGSAMNNASPGQQVRVKMAGGQVISGIVKDGATVQVQM
jgi:flagellar basal body P-ring formation protein FlgA